MTTAPASGEGEKMSLKDQGNEFLKSGKYLKAAALYTHAIRQDPSNTTLYSYILSDLVTLSSNCAAALLQLDKLTKSLEDAEMTIKLDLNGKRGSLGKDAYLRP